MMLGYITQGEVTLNNQERNALAAIEAASSSYLLVLSTLCTYRKKLT